MLPSLSIRNFRALENFNVPHLGRVNLLVGKNNSGKSTVLEALRIYAQHGSPALLDELLIGHDETLRALGPSNATEEEQIPYQNFFPGRRFPTQDDASIYIGDQAGADFVRITHTYYIEETIAETDGVRSLKRTPIPKDAQHDEASQALLISSSRRDQPRWMQISETDLPGLRRRVQSPDQHVLPLGYVPTGMIPSAGLADLWDSIALTDYDVVLRDGLRIIEPRVEAMAFVRRENPRARTDLERAAIVKLSDATNPIPLNSMGDGMARVLQLLLALVPARGGLYLVDEFENGLHYSVQESIWKMIFELAAKNDIQVFAATHSWDCVEAFRSAAMATDAPAALFRIGRSVRKSEAGRVIATVFDKNTLADLTQNDVEVR